MHVVSLMYSILSAIEESAKEHRVTKISKIKLIVGTERMVLPDALLFAFHLLKKEPLTNDAVLEMEERKGRDFYIEYFEGE